MESFFDRNKNSNQVWLYLNSAENAVDFLESACVFLDRADNLKWKWAGLSLFQALYGYANTVLSNGSPTDLSSNWKDKDVKLKRGSFDQCYKSVLRYRKPTGYRIEWVEIPREEVEDLSESPIDPKQYLEEQLKHLDYNIIHIWSSLARIQDEFHWMNRLSISQAIKINDEEWEYICFLVETIRNKVIHFGSEIFQLHIESARASMITTINVIERLVVNNKYMFSYEDQIARSMHSIGNIKEKLRKEA